MDPNTKLMWITTELVRLFSRALCFPSIYGGHALRFGHHIRLVTYSTDLGIGLQEVTP